MAVNKLQYVDNIEFTNDCRLIGMVLERDLVRIQKDVERRGHRIKSDIHIDITKNGELLRMHFIIDWE